MKGHLIIIGFGPVSGYKYTRFIKLAVEGEHIDGYTIIDKESKKDVVMNRLESVSIQPLDIIFIPDVFLQDSISDGIGWLNDYFLKTSCKYKGLLKVVIATEAQAHEEYLKYCIKMGFDTLCTKPLILPMKDGLFAPEKLVEKVHELIELAGENAHRHSLICLGRHHEIYDKKIRNYIMFMMNRLRVPITSIHLKTASGVWNLPYEYSLREDHPYKFGYGMLMHGSYHYIDIFARFLLMNKNLFPNKDMLLEITGFSTFPSDQNIRIPNSVTSRLTDYITDFEHLEENYVYGENDVVMVCSLKLKETNQVICLGTLSLEQTTPGMRSWGPFPEVPYNINGRLHCTDLDVRLATVFSANANVVKTPIGARVNKQDLRGKNIGHVTVRSNADIAGTQEFFREEKIVKPYGKSFSYCSESEIFLRWIKGEKTYSDIASHLPTITLLEGLSKAVKNNGEKIKIEFNFDFPEWPEVVNDDEFTFQDIETNNFFGEK
ncbi:hypothetical protein [Erwinia rhapontici]|uniref:hypothetical protein n=1 Tax=Erwinia rhapontici TaxID=55212 RepID=UPI0013316E8C|nr:hypothetical protein [Erwinia rhapontici]MBP2156374.1 hypothetical protein [Erwinia rhapontici]